MYNHSNSRIHGNHSHDDVSEQISDFPTVKDNKTLFKPATSPYDQARIDLLMQTENKEEFTNSFCVQKCLNLSDPSYIPFCFEKRCNLTQDQAKNYWEGNN
jgi:hypothetical protein